MTDEDKNNVVAFEVEYDIYVDVMSNAVRPGDIVVTEVNNE